ncbi:hypothetical protein, partial [Virgisporangium ochraceum]|uniref:hypothetical protein n=1 Tax=Virgisporangium ochraceum TaxID=65505 RepID=UPI001940A251
NGNDGNGNGDGNNPPGSSGPDPFDQLPPERQQQLIDDVIADSNKDFPMTRENAEAVLRGGPPGTTPHVAGPGVAGGDVQFRDPDGNTVLARENKSIGAGYNAWTKEVRHAAQDQLDGSGEVWVQVRNGSDVDSWVRRFQGSRTPERLADYENVDVIFRDADGNLLGEYNLGTRLPPRE